MNQNVLTLILKSPTFVPFGVNLSKSEAKSTKSVLAGVFVCVARCQSIVPLFNQSAHHPLATNDSGNKVDQAAECGNKIPESNNGRRQVFTDVVLVDFLDLVCFMKPRFSVSSSEQLLTPYDWIVLS